MHREGQLDDTQIGPQMSTGLADLLDEEGPDLQAQFLELTFGEVP
jgi:hypothetical protein